MNCNYGVNKQLNHLTFFLLVWSLKLWCDLTFVLKLGFIHTVLVWSHYLWVWLKPVWCDHCSCFPLMIRSCSCFHCFKSAGKCRPRRARCTILMSLHTTRSSTWPWRWRKSFLLAWLEAHEHRQNPRRKREENWTFHWRERAFLLNNRWATRLLSKTN